MPLYRAFGLVFDSDLLLPGLPQTRESPDVKIVHRLVDEHYAQDLSIRLDEFTFDIQLDSIRYLVSRRQIDIEVPRDVDRGLVVGWLTGAVMGTLLIQRERLLLHANAVVLPDGAGIAAFVGPSGAGKSTIAALFARSNFDLFGDDLIAVRFEGGPMVDRGIPRVKLWRDTLDHLAVGADDLRRVVRRADKFELDLPVAIHDQQPLRRIYLLDRGDDAPRIARLSGAEAARSIVDNVYRWPAAEAWHGGSQWIFERCLDLARMLDVYSFTRPWTLDRLDEGFKLIDEHLRT